MVIVLLVKMGAIRQGNYLEIIAAMIMMIRGLEEERIRGARHLLMVGAVATSRAPREPTNNKRDTTTRRIMVLVASLRSDFDVNKAVPSQLVHLQDSEIHLQEAVYPI
jgi:hypothetical protein